MENKYVVPQIPGLDSRGIRVLQDFADRLNFLTGEVERSRQNLESRFNGKVDKKGAVPGVVTFPYQNGDGLIRVNQDGLITSYISPVSPVSYQSLIFTDPTDHANSGAGETTIITVPIPGGTLKKKGDFLEYVGEFELAGAGISKTIRYKFDGVNINANPWNNTLDNIQMVEIGRIYRLTSTTVRSYVACSVPFLGQTTDFTQYGDITVSDMDSNTLDFVVTVQATNTNDIRQRLGHLFTCIQT